MFRNAREIMPSRCELVFADELAVALTVTSDVGIFPARFILSSEFVLPVDFRVAAGAVMRALVCNASPGLRS